MASKVSMWSLRVMKEHYSLVPLFGFSVGAGILCGGYFAYMCACKSDISFRPRSWQATAAPYQAVGPQQNTKLVPFLKSTYPPVNTEIETLRRELGNYAA